MKRTSSRIASRSSEASPAQSVLKSAKRKAEERNRVDTTAAASKKAWTCKEKEQLIAGEGCMQWNSLETNIGLSHLL